MIRFDKITGIINKFTTMNFFNKLIEKDTGVSSKSFFLVIVTLVGAFLLLVPAIILIVEVCYNHTIQTDLNGLAAYIGAVAGVFVSAGVTKVWGSKYDNRNETPKGNKQD